MIKIPLGEVNVGVDDDLVLGAFDGHGGSEVVDFSLHLDAVLEELGLCGSCCKEVH